MLTEQQKSDLCIRCQACCCWVPIFLQNESNEQYQSMLEFFKTRGQEIKETEKGNIIKIFNPCIHLTLTGCNIYKDRPQVCRDTNGEVDITFKDECLWLREMNHD